MCEQCSELDRISFKGHNYCWKHFDEVRGEKPVDSSLPLNPEDFVGIYGFGI